MHLTRTEAYGHAGRVTRCPDIEDTIQLRATGSVSRLPRCIRQRDFEQSVEPCLQLARS